MPDTATGTSVQIIKTCANSIDNIFDPRDPSDLEQRALNPDFVEYLLSQLDTHNPMAPVRIEISGGAQKTPDLPAIITTKLHDAVATTQQDLNHHFKDARKVLAIAFGIMVACVAIYKITALFPLPGALAAFHESLYVFGWVAMWRPAEMFFYDWIPIVARRKSLSRLANATIIIQDQ